MTDIVSRIRARPHDAPMPTEYMLDDAADHIELLEGGDKPGLKGRVIDINVIYTTLEETGDHAGSVLQVPNSLFFQRTTRRWRETSGFHSP